MTAADANVAPTPTVAFRPAWVRDNPYRLNSTQIAGIRSTRHLTDVPLPNRLFGALLRAGHRYSGELSYMTFEEVAGVPGVGPSGAAIIRRVLEDAGHRLGTMAYERASDTL